MSPTPVPTVTPIPPSIQISIDYAEIARQAMYYFSLLWEIKGPGDIDIGFYLLGIISLPALAVALHKIFR